MKAYFITNVENPDSRQIGKRHVEIANAFGDFDSSIFIATRADEAAHFLSSQGIEFLKKPYRTKEIERRTDPKAGVKGCFCSHYRLWQHCVEIDEPIGIFEYDARQMMPLPPDAAEFQSYLYLSAWRNMNGNPNDYCETLSEPGLHLYHGYHSWGLNNVTSGSHAYLIRPSAASELLWTVHHKGWLSTDRIISTDLVSFEKETLVPAAFKVSGSLNLSQLDV